LLLLLFSFLFLFCSFESGSGGPSHRPLSPHWAAASGEGFPFHDLRHCGGSYLGASEAEEIYCRRCTGRGSQRHQHGQAHNEGPDLSLQGWRTNGKLRMIIWGGFCLVVLHYFEKGNLFCFWRRQEDKKTKGKRRKRQRRKRRKRRKKAEGRRQKAEGRR